MTIRISAFAATSAGLGSWFVPLGIRWSCFPGWWPSYCAWMLSRSAWRRWPSWRRRCCSALGGLAADRGNPRKLLLRYHLLYAIPPLVLAGVLARDGLSYPMLIVYGIAAGSIGAFAIPTRDALLPTVAAGNLPRAVALATALQFGGQLIGIACASSADRIGAPPLLILQAALVLLGLLAVLRLPVPTPHPPAEHPGFWRSVSEGVSAAAKSDQIWPVLLRSASASVSSRWTVPRCPCRWWCATAITAAPPRRLRQPRLLGRDHRGRRGFAAFGRRFTLRGASSPLRLRWARSSCWRSPACRIRSSWR